MTTKGHLIAKTYGIYALDMLLCLLFLLGFNGLTWLQLILALGVFAGFCMLCYNEGGNAGEHACTVQRMVEKREAEGRNVDDSTKREFFDKKIAVSVLLAVAIPLAVLATVNLIVSPNYPVVTQEETQVVESGEDPFAYAPSGTAPADFEAEPMPQLLLRMVSRLVFAPLIPFYTILENNQTLLYALFIPFSFIMPACTAWGYLSGPRIREKKIEEIARGKVRKKRGLLVGGRKGPRQPRQPKPLV